MKTINWVNAVVSVLMALAFGVLGFFVAGWVVRHQVKGTFARWRSLGTTPERAVRFIGLHPHVGAGRDVDVYVETVTGTIYRYVCCSQRQAAWHEVQIANEVWPGVCDRDDPGEIIPRPALARLPTKVIACEEILWDPDSNDVSYFVLLEDHSIWWWRQNVGLGTVVTWLLGGPALGASLGVSLVFLLKRLRVRRLKPMCGRVKGGM